MKIIGERIIHKGRFLDFKEVEILLPNGNKKKWEKVSRKSPGLTDEMSYDFFVEVSGEKQSQQLGEYEDIEVIEFSKKNINNSLSLKEKSGVLISPGIYAMLYKYFFDIKLY